MAKVEFNLYYVKKNLIYQISSQYHKREKSPEN